MSFIPLTQKAAKKLTMQEFDNYYLSARAYLDTIYSSLRLQHLNIGQTIELAKVQLKVQAIFKEAEEDASLSFAEKLEKYGKTR